MIAFQKQVDCLNNGAPHAKSANEFIDSLKIIPSTPDSFFLRCIVTWELFQRTEALLSKDDFDVLEFSEFLSELSKRIQNNWKIQLEFNSKLDFSSISMNLGDFAHATMEHYGNLFKKFDDNHYIDETEDLLEARIKRNEISLGNLSVQHALDAGCGGGRYSYALKSIGFGKVTGIDFSQINIDTASQRRKNFSAIDFQVGNVLDLPFESASFDFVFSNGVLHHTESISKGLKEIRRVLKMSGKAWLYVIEKPGGLHWDMVEILRNVMEPVSREYARAIFSLLGVPGNRIFYILDHIMVPINERTTIDQIEKLILDAGFSNFSRLTRGTDFDRSEQLFRRNKLNQKDLEWKFGVGEHRYIMLP